jgi:hypothetical protein
MSFEKNKNFWGMIIEKPSLLSTSKHKSYKCVKK